MQDDTQQHAAGESDTQEAADSAAQTAGSRGSGADELAAMMEELEKLRQMAARAQADLQNAKQRMEREAADARRYATERLLLRLLPTLDNLRRASQHVPDSLRESDWVKGVLAIGQECERQLADEGLRPMQSLGMPIDPSQHEVLQAGPGEEGTVTAVYEEGYLLHDRVLRPAKVQAGNGESESAGLSGEQNDEDADAVE